MKNFLLFILLVLGAASCQPTYVVNDSLFSNLSNGAVLVRLESYQKQIKFLEGKNDELLQRVISERNKRNKETIDAFSGFTFCPVYFFYSADSRKILEKEFEGVLMNADLEKLESIKNLDNNYVIAEFGETRSDTIHVAATEYTYSEQGEELSQNEIKYAQETMSIKVDALVLYSPELVPIQNPYPHYVRTFEGFPFIERSKSEAVRRLQAKITDYLRNY